MVHMAPHPWGDQVKEFFESFGVVAKSTGGLSLLVLTPAVPVLLLFGGLMAVGRGCWSKGTESKRIQRARITLAAARYPGDELYRSIAEDVLLTHKP